MEQMVEERLACEQQAHVLEIGLSHWTQEEIRQGRSKLQAQLLQIDICLEQGRSDYRSTLPEWNKKVKRFNEKRRHTATHLREAALRSTVSKLLSRTARRLSKLRVATAE